MLWFQRHYCQIYFMIGPTIPVAEKLFLRSALITVVFDFLEGGPSHRARHALENMTRALNQDQIQMQSSEVTWKTMAYQYQLPNVAYGVRMVYRSTMTPRSEMLSCRPHSIAAIQR